ncbi:uncharacterized protein LOC132191056 [Corylus avellana]|uniref:uncharacterized protein LOC132191056 n=1 Tax=Corylus avellana TaxID=13451 RepID=UPI00286B1CAE|nr:uncharacterized protein LOC132191056 [Corylus avellana]
MKVKWKPPPQGIIKLNWDATVAIKERKMGVEVIARDYTGKVLATLSAPRPIVSDPTVAETIGAWMSVDLTSHLGFTRIYLEGDALEIVQALRMEGSCWSRYEHLINDAKILIQKFQFWEVDHVKREANEVAHILAKKALACGTTQFCEEHILDCISHIV